MIYVVLITCVALEVIIVLLAIIVIAMLVYPAVMKFETYYRNWKYKKWIKKQNKDYEEYQQRKRKERLQKELHRKEMEDYPLFFWRKTCKKETLSVTVQFDWPKYSEIIQWKPLRTFW